MKKIVVFLLILLLAATLFAKDLTDQDVKSFCANYEKIEEAFNKEFGELMADPGNGPTPEQNSIACAILNRYGISGENSIEKMTAIGYCMSYIMVEQALKEQPEAAAYYQQMGIDPMEEIKPYIDMEDLEVVRNNFDLLASTLDA